MNEQKLETVRSEASKSEKKRNIVVINSMRGTSKLLVDLMRRVSSHPYYVKNKEVFKIPDSYEELFRSLEHQSAFAEITTEDYPDSDVSVTFNQLHDLHYRGLQYLFAVTLDYRNLSDPVFLRFMT